MIEERDIDAQLSEMYDIPVDVQGADSVRRRNQQPAGDYETVPEEFGEFSCTPSTSEDGRVTFTFFGRGRITRKGETTEAALRYRLSPDARPKKNFETGEEIEGKDDLQTRLWAEAVALYSNGNGSAPGTRRHLLEYLQAARIRLNTMNGEDGLIVLHLKAARPGRA